MAAISYIEAAAAAAAEKETFSLIRADRQRAAEAYRKLLTARARVRIGLRNNSLFTRIAGGIAARRLLAAAAAVNDEWLTRLSMIMSHLWHEREGVVVVVVIISGCRQQGSQLVCIGFARQR